MVSSNTGLPCLRRKLASRALSCSEMYGPCRRTHRDEAGGRKSMSPLPSSCSAPLASRIVRESVFDDTRNEMREGRLALIKPVMTRSEEHTSELQSQSNLVCRLLLEKKKKKKKKKTLKKERNMQCES